MPVIIIVRYCDQLPSLVGGVYQLWRSPPTKLGRLRHQGDIRETSEDEFENVIQEKRQEASLGDSIKPSFKNAQNHPLALSESTGKCNHPLLALRAPWRSKERRIAVCHHVAPVAQKGDLTKRSRQAPRHRPPEKTEAHGL